MSDADEFLSRLDRMVAMAGSPAMAREGYESTPALLAALAPRARSPFGRGERRPLEALLRRRELDGNLKAEYRSGWKRTEGGALLPDPWRELLAAILVAQSALPEAPRGWALKCVNSAFRVTDGTASEWRAGAQRVLAELLKGVPA